jgi:hypothetical protein
MALAVGIMAGLITITMSRATYNASDSNPDDIQFREWPIYEPEDVDDPDRKARHLEPISCTYYESIETAQALTKF